MGGRKKNQSRDRRKDFALPYPQAGHAREGNGTAILILCSATLYISRLHKSANRSDLTGHPVAANFVLRKMDYTEAIE
jgi:hypothetical protein